MNFTVIKNTNLQEEELYRGEIHKYFRNKNFTAVKHTNVTGTNTVM
jgi:hypothetical protein